MALELSSLGVIACPGGGPFATALISRLETLERQEEIKRIRHLSREFSLSKEEANKFLGILKEREDSFQKYRHSSSTSTLSDLQIDCRFTRFSNGEFKTEIMESVRHRNVFVVQDVGNSQPVVYENETSYELSVNDHLMSLYVTIDALLQARPREITLVLPLYPYSRQHKRNGREGLTASSLGRIFENMGIRTILTLDIHSRSTENSFGHMGLENLKASYQVIKKLWTIVDLNTDDLVVLAPDTGSVERNKFYAVSLGKPLAMIYKERDYSKLSTSATHSNIITSHLLGEVEGKTVFIPDDILGTGGTLLKTMKLMKERGAKRVICAVSLPLFDNNAVEYFDKAYEEGLFYRMICTDAVHLNKEITEREWYVRASVVRLFAAAIANLHLDRSISQLMDSRPLILRLMEQKSREAEEADELEDSDLAD